MNPVFEEVKASLLNFGYDIPIEYVSAICERFGITEPEHITADNIEFLVAQLQSKDTPAQSQESNTATLEAIKIELLKKAEKDASELSAIIIAHPEIVRQTVLQTVQEHENFLKENPQKVPLFVHLGITKGQINLNTISVLSWITPVLLGLMLILAFMVNHAKYPESSTSKSDFYDRLF